MPFQVCCPGSDRPDSPDAPMARNAGMVRISQRPLVRHKSMPATNTAWSSALDAQDDHELQQIFCIANTDSVLPDPRSLASINDTTIGPFRTPRSNTASFVDVLRQRFSRESTRTRPENDLWILRQIQEDSNSPRNISNHSYDPDAQPLLKEPSFGQSFKSLNIIEEGNFLALDGGGCDNIHEPISFKDPTPSLQSDTESLRISLTGNVLSKSVHRPPPTRRVSSSTYSVASSEAPVPEVIEKQQVVIEQASPHASREPSGSKTHSSEGSVHLQHMRISQHLRSLSSFSGSNYGSVESRLNIPDVPVLHKETDAIQPTVTYAAGELIQEVAALHDAADLLLGNLRSASDTFRSTRLVLDPPELPQTARTATFSDPVNVIPLESHESQVVDLSRCQSFDGPYDRARTLSSFPQKPRIGSVAANFDDTAAMWSRAMTMHQERQNRPSRYSRSSRSIMPVELQEEFHRSNGGSVASRKTSTATGGAGSIEFTHINTGHSFDLLPVGRRNLAPPMRDEDDDDSSSAHCPLQNEIDVPAGLQILVTEPSPETVISEPSPTGKHQRSELEAWSRYPSHNTEERNGPAGVIDNVMVRDFAPIASVEDTESESDVTIRDKRKRKTAKAKSLIWRMKMLPGWPARFVQRNTDFRRRQAGHRTSIALGGVLEYPELELIPGTEATMLPEWNESFAMNTSRSRRRSRSSEGGTTGNERRVSDDGADFTHEMRQIHRHRTASVAPDEGRPPGSSWAGAFGMHHHASTLPRYARRHTDLVSPLDGPATTTVQAGKDDTVAVTMVKRPNLRMAASVDELRKSTKDLREMLRLMESKEVERAMKAEEAW